ncbi:von Willebrand factor D and EGF domain-containing protein-like [Argopecten irradians]|uniref:von Willebrand factor D and EGF domain-containing protein-like n=1 Tax=Argopecten irradians TaxID=31199 RepID=UPI0037141D73
MNGTIPDADGKQHVLPLCVTNRATGETCADKMSIYVTNCTTHIMYDLSSPPTSSAYCFDIPSDSTDPPPSYRPTRVKVKFDIHRNDDIMSNSAFDSDTKPYIRFHCDFERDENNAHFYVIYFHVDGNFVNLGIDLVVYDTEDAFVTEGTLVSKFGFKAGITISCSVGVRSSRSGQTGSLVTSEGFYAGIKLLNQSISVERGQSSTVYFKQTVPFGCALSSPWVVNTGDCKLQLHVVITTENVCYSNTIHHRGRCAIEIQGLATATSSDIWDPQTYSFELVSVESMRGLYDLSKRQFFFHLETSSSNHQFWENVKSDYAQVNVNRGTDDHVWQGKYCYVVCDPHMMSFDGMPYELQYPGKFLLFKHESIPVQVQVEITSCYGNSRTPYCACGLVVAAGKDVFEIYLCNGHRGIRYKSCIDGVLTVVKTSNANYKIYLPTGSIINVKMRMGYDLLDIYIAPTLHEYRERISGLCGDLDGNIANDCVSKGGSLPCKEPVSGRWAYYPNTFTQSYRLNPTEVLLNTDINTDSLPSYPRSHETCSCTNDVHATPQCFSRQYAICSNPRNQVKCTNIKQMPIRKKRHAEHSNSYEHHDIVKRQAAVFNESEAIKLCTEALNTVTNEACSQIGVNSSSEEINNCAADLMLTGDGNWTKYAIDRSESLCVETLEKNTTLQEENPDISNIIRNNTCPLNCSEQGFCSNGKCMCQEGFASEDCSFDLSKPLEIFGLENGGVCDIDDSCSYVVVEGLEFPSDINITCQFSGQAVLVGEISHTLDVSNVTADPNTLFAIICELPVIDTPSDRLGIEYNVSVAMEGFEFSEAISFVVIDTVCQDYVNNSGKITFYIKDGFCFINGTCHPEGSYKEDALCLECRPRENLHMWSNSTIEDCVVSDKETEDTTSDVIIIVISAVTGSLSVCLLV